MRIKRERVSHSTQLNASSTSLASDSLVISLTATAYHWIQERLKPFRRCLHHPIFLSCGGMVNNLNKFSPNITELSQPLRELLSPQKTWMWTDTHKDAFEKVKEEISSPRILAHYDTKKETKISVDASAYGLGAVLLQRHDTGWRPVAFASRSLSQAESRYAQIEKEALALTWACERFSEYVLGKVIELETDHKPLVPIMGKKSLDTLPPRVLHFRLRLMQFQYTIHHSPGKSLYLADTLSRAPLGIPTDEVDSLAEKEVESFVGVVVAALPAHGTGIDRHRQVTPSVLN